MVYIFLGSRKVSEMKGSDLGEWKSYFVSFNLWTVQVFKKTCCCAVLQDEDTNVVAGKESSSP